MKYILICLLIFYQAFSFPDFFGLGKKHETEISIKIEKNPINMYWLKLDKGGYMLVGDPPEPDCREISDFPVDKLKKAIEKNIKTGKKTLFVKSLNGEIYLGKEPVYDDGKRFHIRGLNPTTGITRREYNKLLEIKKTDEEEFKNLLKNWLPENKLPKKLWLVCKKREFSEKSPKYIVHVYPLTLSVKKPDVEIVKIEGSSKYIKMKVLVFPFFPVKGKKISSLNLNPFQRDINIGFTITLENPPKINKNIYILPIPEKINSKEISYLYSWWNKKEKFAVGSERIYTNPIEIQFKICKVKTGKNLKEIDVLNSKLKILNCNFRINKKIKLKGKIKFIVDANFNDNIPDIWTKNEPEWIGTPVNRKPKEFVKKFEFYLKP